MERNEATAGNSAKNTLEAMGRACREPEWREVSLETKIERLRDTLLRVERVLDVTHKRANDALRTAKNHDHNALGEVMVPAADKFVPSLEDLHFEVRHVFNALR